MSFFTTLQVLLRRWYLVLAGLSLTALAAGAAFSTVTPTFEARGTLLLVLPTAEVPEGTPANPFLLYGGLAPIAEVATAGVMGDESIDRLVAMGASEDFVVERDPYSQAPIIEVVARSSSEVGTLQTISMVRDAFADELARRQAAVGAPQVAWVEATDLVPATQTTELFGSQIRVLVAILALGGGATLYTIFAMEGIVGGLARLRVRAATTSSRPFDEHSSPLDDAPSSGSDEPGERLPVDHLQRSSTVR